ncbi:MAG: hypothetical protein R3284_03030 [Rubricoccaceae bacterium]|nr:hypothetical protein [Rubricoccaceae bacterium]
MFKPLSVVLVSIFLFAACDSADSDNSLQPRFFISVMDESTTIASGDFMFGEEPQPGVSATGTFSLSTTSGEPIEPMMSTSGEFDFVVTDEGRLAVTIEEPGVSDTGLRFEGEYDISGFSGEWGTITFAGYTEQGTFQADPIL